MEMAGECNAGAVMSIARTQRRKPQHTPHGSFPRSRRARTMFTTRPLQFTYPRSRPTAACHPNPLETALARHYIPTPPTDRGAPSRKPAHTTLPCSRCAHDLVTCAVQYRHCSAPSTRPQSEKIQHPGERTETRPQQQRQQERARKAAKGQVRNQQSAAPPAPTAFKQAAKR